MDTCPARAEFHVIGKKVPVVSIHVSDTLRRFVSHRKQLRIENKSKRAHGHMTLSEGIKKYKRFSM